MIFLLFGNRNSLLKYIRGYSEIFCVVVLRPLLVKYLALFASWQKLARSTVHRIKPIVGRKFFFVLFILGWATTSIAQEQDISEDIAAIVFLDSFVVSASQQGFVVADFIDIIQEDDSFFQAFHNLRFQEHEVYSDFQFFDKKQRSQASCSNRGHQKVAENCRTMEILSEEVRGNFFKNKTKRTHQYYTARMHESVFFTKGKICEKRNKPTVSTEKLSGIQKHINELKKLIFQPGQAVQIPLIGGKTAIFEKEMIPYYQFYIGQDTLSYEEPCYTFTVAVKPDKRPSKTIVKYLKTWFDKESFQVLGRQYHLSYSGVVGFDVKMTVAIQQVDADYLPKSIQYDGTWKIPLQKRETGTFQVNIKVNEGR